jgi:ATP-dependent RNA helicase DOB1
LIVIPDESRVAEYYELRQQLDQMAADFREVITHPTYSLPFLQSGRLVKVKHKALDFGWGVVVNFQKRLPPKVRIVSRSPYPRNSISGTESAYA